MIGFIHSVKKNYKDKKIYVWNVVRESLELFALLSYRRVDVQGFVSYEDRYIGERILNRGVVSIDDVNREEEAVIVCYSRQYVKQAVSSDIEVVEYNEMLEINPILRERDVYLYGAGEGARRLYDELAHEQIGINGIYSSADEGNRTFCGLPIVKFGNETSIDTQSIIVIAVKTEKSMREILSIFSKRGSRDDILISDYSMDRMWPISLFQMLDDAVKTGKGIYLYGREDSTAQLLKEICNNYGIKIDSQVYEEEEGEIRDVYDVCVENAEKSVIVLNEPNIEKMLEALEIMGSMGYSLEKLNYGSVFNYTYNRKMLCGMYAYIYDKLVVCSIDYSGLGGIPGWRVYGNAKSPHRIMIVGGSTSSEVFYPESWPCKLYRRLQEKGIDAAVYNGAHEGNNIEMEFSRVIRDMEYIKPTTVISLSGLNNTFDFDDRMKFSYSRKGEGESDFQRWRRYARMMRNIVEESGATFISVLQPMNTYMPQMTLKESMQYRFEVRDGRAKAFYEEASCGNEYINCIDAFFHKDGMIFDGGHYTDAGNEWIADMIYSVLEEQRCIY